MRLPTAALALALVACSAEPAPSPVPDAAPEAAGPDASAADAAPDALQDAAPEAPPPMDAPPEAAADAAQDADPRQSEVCRAVNATCDGRRVNVQTGERDGGVTYHCGGCGIVCPAGQGCLSCVCIPL